MYVCMNESIYVCTYTLFVNKRKKKKHDIGKKYCHLIILLQNQRHRTEIQVSMYVSMYRCMYVCMYRCMYVCLYVFMYQCMYVHILYLKQERKEHNIGKTNITIGLFFTE